MYWIFQDSFTKMSSVLIFFTDVQLSPNAHTVKVCVYNKALTVSEATVTMVSEVIH